MLRWGLGLFQSKRQQQKWEIKRAESFISLLVHGRNRNFQERENLADYPISVRSSLVSRQVVFLQ
jgi:hypothetical protein